MLVGYMRVSTATQSFESQFEALRAAGCDARNIYGDIASGARADRPGLADALKFVQAGDTLIVTRLDRLGRTTIDLLRMIDGLASKEVTFRALQQDFDTSSSTGRAFLSIMSVMAEMERDLIQERVREGVRTAAAAGRRGGRPKSITPDLLRTIQHVIDSEGLTQSAAAARFKLSSSTLCRALKRLERETQDV